MLLEVYKSIELLDNKNSEIIFEENSFYSAYLKDIGEKNIKGSRGRGTGNIVDELNKLPGFFLNRDFWEKWE